MSDKVFIFRLLKHLSEILKLVWHYYSKKENQTKCTEKDAIMDAGLMDAEDTIGDADTEE